MDDNFYIYFLLRDDKTPFYIGKGKGKRATQHYQKNRLDKDKSAKGKYIKKYFSENNKFPEFKIYKNNLTEEEAFIEEKMLIKKYGRKTDDTGILLNLTEGGEGVSGYKFSKDVVRERSQKIKGVPRSKETKEKISDKLKGRKRPKEVVEKISQSVRGKKKTKTPKLIASYEKRRGKKRSKEYGEKVRKRQLGVPKSKETKEKISKKLRHVYRLKYKDVLIEITDMKKWLIENNYGNGVRSIIASLAKKGFYTVTTKTKTYKYYSWNGYTSYIKPPL